MQTFLPFADYNLTAQCLDRDRLGKQRVECLQILKALANPSYGWQNHPAVQMWKGYELHLYHCYMASIIAEWLKRGCKDTCYEKARLVVANTNWQTQSLDAPWWMGYEPLHSSHRAVLLHKRPRHYQSFGWTEQPALTTFGKYPYVWPTKLPADVVNQLKQNANSSASSSASLALNAQ